FKDNSGLVLLKSEISRRNRCRRIGGRYFDFLPQIKIRSPNAAYQKECFWVLLGRQPKVPPAERTGVNLKIKRAVKEPTRIRTPKKKNSSRKTIVQSLP
ncbi:MAG: hypothetical protein Q4D20_10590, partial [Clostridia bacterium]|nr:hypothetical protein [Clostridia bacterium]